MFNYWQHLFKLFLALSNYYFPTDLVEWSQCDIRLSPVPVLPLSRFATSAELVHKSVSSSSTNSEVPPTPFYKGQNKDKTSSVMCPRPHSQQVAGSVLELRTQICTTSSTSPAPCIVRALIGRDSLSHCCLYPQWSSAWEIWQIQATSNVLKTICCWTRGWECFALGRSWKHLISILIKKKKKKKLTRMLQLFRLR